MFELEINGAMYQFKFGMAFLRDINKTVSRPLEGIPNKKQDVGLRLAIGELIDGNVDTLVDVLFRANAGQSPRLTKSTLDTYIEEEVTDIDALFDEVLDFLEQSNCTKKETTLIREAYKVQSAQSN